MANDPERPEADADGTPPRRLTAERVERAVYVARNDRGAEVRIGGPDAEAAFTPGELLQIAAASCAALSADHVLSSKLGLDFDATFSVEGDGVRGENRYSAIRSTVVVDMSEIDTEKQTALVERAVKAVDRLCSVGRTIKQSATAEVELLADQG
ncbi:OsmC family protein [Tessaracoccus sp. MC1756]|uniref:OsmC family protein n=1 Tax=Tessaracoccus sp. MC1756 TaxID=2760311 RepID=UPI0016026711|nr:OsmC family protein [Tessaracoccus sp. MC1756]MBB1509705.1 OsmC family protein [Tessaracoccus sp. MC1756]